MKEHNVTKEETISKFNRWIEDRWRQVNQALLKPTAVSPVVIEMVYNFCCRIELIYNYTGDGFNKCANLKEFINLLYVEKLLIWFDLDLGLAQVFVLFSFWHAIIYN